MDEDTKVMQSESICFCCKHSMLMVVATRKRRLEADPLTQRPRPKETIEETQQAACHRWAGAMVIGSQSLIQACTGFEPGEEKQFMVPAHMEPPKSLKM